MTVGSPDLRALISEVVRDLVAEMATDVFAQEKAAVAVPQVSGGGRPVISDAPVVPPADGRTRVEVVPMASDADLDAFARRVLALFENPKNRQDLRAGRLRFRIEAGRQVQPTVARPVLRIDTGAVTERQVKAAADAGQRIVLGRRAVVTPLGRDRARVLRVPIEKEQ